MSDEISDNTSLSLSVSQLRDVFDDNTEGVSFSEFYRGSSRGLVEADDFNSSFDEAPSLGNYARTRPGDNNLDLRVTSDLRISQNSGGIPDVNVSPGGFFYTTDEMVLDDIYQVWIDSEPFTQSEYNALAEVAISTTTPDETFYKIKWRRAENTTIPTQGALDLSDFYGSEDIEALGEFEDGVFYFPQKDALFDFNNYDQHTPYSGRVYAKKNFNLGEELDKCSTYHDTKHLITKIVFVMPYSSVMWSENPTKPAFLADNIDDHIELHLHFGGIVMGAGGHGGSARVDPDDILRQGQDGGDAIVVDHPGDKTFITIEDNGLAAGGGGGGAAGWYKESDYVDTNYLSGIFGSGGGGGAGGGAGGAAIYRATVGGSGHPVIGPLQRKSYNPNGDQNNRGATALGFSNSNAGGTNPHSIRDTRSFTGSTAKAGGNGGAIIKKYYEDAQLTSMSNFPSSSSSFNSNYYWKEVHSTGQFINNSRAIIWGGQEIANTTSYSSYYTGSAGGSQVTDPPLSIGVDDSLSSGNFLNQDTLGGIGDKYFIGDDGFYYGRGNSYSSSPSNQTNYGIYRYKYQKGGIRRLKSETFLNAPAGTSLSGNNQSLISVATGGQGGWLTNISPYDFAPGFGKNNDPAIWDPQIIPDDLYTPPYHVDVEEPNSSATKIEGGGYGGTGIFGGYHAGFGLGGDAGDHYWIYSYQFINFHGAGAGGGGWGARGGQATTANMGVISFDNINGGDGGIAVKFTQGTTYSEATPQSKIGYKSGDVESDDGGVRSYGGGPVPYVS